MTMKEYLDQGPLLEQRIQSDNSQSVEESAEEQTEPERIRTDGTEQGRQPEH